MKLTTIRTSLGQDKGKLATGGYCDIAMVDWKKNVVPWIRGGMLERSATGDFIPCDARCGAWVTGQEIAIGVANVDVVGSRVCPAPFKFIPGL